MTPKFLAQYTVLIAYRKMPVATTPIGHRFDATGQAIGCRLTSNHPLSATRFTPEMSKPQKVERARSVAGPTLAIGTIERDQSRLLRVERKTVSAKSLWQNLHHATRIRFIGKHDDEIIGIPNQIRLTGQAWLNISIEP